MVAKPLTECNIFFKCFFRVPQCPARCCWWCRRNFSCACRGAVSPLILFCFCPPMCYHATAQTAHRATRRWFRLCECFMRFFSVTREQMSAHGSHTVKRAVVFDCAVPSASPSQATDVEVCFRNRFARWTVVQRALVSVVLSHDCSWMFAARQCESVSTELHGKRRGVSRCGVSVLPCGGHWI